jgi:hypothetical protein
MARYKNPIFIRLYCSGARYCIDDILFSNNTNKGSIIKDQELRKSELYKSKKGAFLDAWEIDLNICWVYIYIRLCK